MKNLKFLFLMSPIALFADGVAAAQEGGAPATILMIVVALFFFYFIMWRPEQKRRRRTQEMREQMKAGDTVQAMGIVGTINELREETIVIKTAGSSIEILKAAITQVDSAKSS